MTAATTGNFQTQCRRWRQFRKLSQLDLALAADVSQRHVSWLETGRSRPSREMVVRLSEAMDLPLRERNTLLSAAGFAPLYNESPLEEAAMAPVLEALNRVLQHHDPLPAVVIDRFWNVKRMNNAAQLMLGLAGDPQAMQDAVGGGGDINLALLTLHPDGMRPFISNWEQAAPSFIRRLRGEARASGDPEMEARFARFIEAAGPVADSETLLDPLLPVLPLELDINGVALSLFTVISTFGTPQDVTTDELRIEAASGEVCIRGPELAQGYLDPTHDRDVFVDGWYHTGDTGTLYDEGWLTITGRIAGTIIRGGENIAVAAVEAMVEAHPAVTAAVVIGRPDERLGETVAAGSGGVEHRAISGDRAL